MLQMMVKKIEAEAVKETELYDKFMCYCKNSDETLGKSIADADVKMPQLASDIKAAEAEKAQLEQDLQDHQTDRDSAKSAMAKATEIREKEAAAFAKEESNDKSNIDAIYKAIAAIEKGMSGGFLQTSAASILKKVVVSNVDLIDYDREQLVSFLQGSEEAPKSGEIVGILKQLASEMDKAYAEMVAQEEAAIKAYEELMAAKKKEIEALTKAIEEKMVRVGELGVEIVSMKNDLTDTEEALIEDTKFLADLKKNCASKTKEWDERCKTRSEELRALQTQSRF
jgi:chromosome segregation ATPase